MEILAWNSQNVEEYIAMQYLPLYRWSVGCKKDISF